MTTCEPVSLCTFTLVVEEEEKSETSLDPIYLLLLVLHLTYLLDSCGLNVPPCLMTEREKYSE